MHYNQFTIDYIDSIRRNLNIEIDDDGRASIFPDSISYEEIVNLTRDIKSIWDRSVSAVDVVKARHDSKFQSGLFGLVEDLELAIKVGFLLGDRVVILDYLFERILFKKNPEDINLPHFYAISTFLVSLLQLAKVGRVVIIPNPLSWNDDLKIVMLEVAAKTTLTPSLISMLNMLSITRLCQLHPYTIAESEHAYRKIINEQIDNANVIGLDAGKYAYEGILAGLLSEKLVSQADLSDILKMPTDKFYNVVSKHEGFHYSYIERVASGGSLCGDNNIERLTNDIIAKKNNHNYSFLLTPLSDIMSVSGATISVASSVFSLSAPLIATGAIMSLSGTLAGLLSKKDNESDVVISLLSKFHK
ncbi:hypothetical protein [Aeromonas sobria]|jgi:hypothetical protein|uniref:hypothetical protein n=1 Tax=Aeromonas sobria TaxID=646 RepID=UPI0012FEA010|nr:hypothetical protein [Aeromonas sobria]